MAGAPLIQVTDLRYTYHVGTAAARPALDGVTFSLDAGEMVAVVGANGSGKSTLAKCLNGLLQPTEGRVLVEGLDTRDTQTLWGIRQRVGMVFQNPDNQLVATVVEEDVAFGPENLGLSSAEIRLRVDQALAAVEMDGYRRHAPHLLSGGQKQRVAIAGILAMRPRCLILDEATTMLDPQGRTEVLETVARLNASEGIAVLLITHAMEDVGQCRRVLVLAQGQIAIDAPPRAVFERAEELKTLRLNLPAVVRLGLELRAGGLAMDPLPLSVDELAARVAQRAAPAM